MITDSEPPRRDRTLRVALLLSLLVHASGAAVYGLTPVSHLLVRPNARPTPEQMVTISDSMRIDKKAVVPPRMRRASAHAPHRRREPMPPPEVAVRPEPPRPRVAAVPPPPTPKPVPRRVSHELAKAAPHARAQPPKTVAALAPQRAETAPPTSPPATPEPTAAPATEPPVRRTAAPPRAVAPPKTAALAEPARPARPSRAHLSAEQIASIDGDLAKSIAKDRSEENPLRVPKTAAAAPRRYKMSVDSVHVGSLKSGEGTYWPIAAGRREADGYTYYRCAYAYQWSDGTFERGVVPWLVRFAPSEDPIVHPELEQGGPIGLPAPPPDFRLAAGAHVGRALRSYFPNTVFTDE